MKKLIILIIIVAAVYYGYNNFYKPETQPQVEDNQNREASNIWLTYNNNSYANYSIQYPGNWQITNEELKTIFSSPDGLDNVTVALQQNGRSATGAKQTTKQIAGQQVIIIEGQDPTDGSPAKFINFNLSNNQKLELQGFGTIFDKMVATLVINSEQPLVENKAEEKEPLSDQNEESAEDQEISTEQGEIQNQEQPETTAAEEETMIIQPEEPEQFVIKLYYPKEEDGDCSKVYGLARQIDTRYNTDEVNSLVTLTMSLNQAAIDQGYFNALANGTRLRRLDITQGVATADFNSALNEGGESCALSTRRAQITETLLQFPDIEQVIITVDGDADTAL